ncbi:PLP-dependent aminotransferase family protein [Luedemannella helvata]|uniref:PLP-dependent aminotransferase family protein n=1 Tax=Luedemannella helvata TaxID=349315 RepID=A0ABP4W246_9ACTN
MIELDRADLHAAITDPAATSMTFLNEVAGRFPDAISLAAGRPYEGFYDTADVTTFLDAYAEHLAARGADRAAVRTQLMQYGRTNGQIHGLIAAMLATDEGIRVPPEAVVVTAGCQEAMVIALRALIAGPRDALLVPSPCYVGISGAARLLGVPMVSVPEGPGGLDPTAVAVAARDARRAGLRPRALYALPNFANPSGVSMPVAARRQLLAVAAAEDLIILEDDPYGLFGLDDTPRPTLKALDERGQVIYLGSFAKSCFPGARVGFLVADQAVVDRDGRRTLLADELASVKSMLTVNTSAIAQAVIGGMLVLAGGSLRAANHDKIAFYRRNLRALLDALDRHLPAPLRERYGLSWNVPDGGFFAVLDTPLPADEALVERSAREHGVLWTPMSFFYADGAPSGAIRLSCSWLEPDRIDEGVRRLAAFVTAELVTPAR